MAYLVQDNTGIEHKVGVKERFELPHEVICLAAPLHLHKRSYVTSCSMLTLHTNTLLAILLQRSLYPLSAMQWCSNYKGKAQSSQE